VNSCLFPENHEDRIFTFARTRLNSGIIRICKKIGLDFARNLQANKPNILMCTGTATYQHWMCHRKRGQITKIRNPASVLKAIKPNTGFGGEETKSKINHMQYKLIDPEE
jgi:hypothetical protein